MDFELRAITEDELPRFHQNAGYGFGYVPTPEDTEQGRTVVEFDRTVAALEGDEIVGSSAAFSFEFTVPGGALLPTAAVSFVAVRPTHRRRGVLTSMMRELLRQAAEREEPLAALWASESVIYPRFGYGLAIEHEKWQIERAHATFASPRVAPGRIRFVSAEEARAAFPVAWEALRPRQPGMSRRSGAFWDIRLTDLERERDGASQFFRVVYEDGGTTEGYALYRIAGSWVDGLPSGEVRVVELIAATPGAHAALWGFLLDLDLTKSVHAEQQSTQDPLRHMLADPRRLRRTTRDALWLRLVDVPAALTGRRYAEAATITLELRDDFMPENAGHWHLDTGVEGASCARTEGDADLALDAADLAALYLGGQRASVLGAAGRIEERRDGALALADRLFASERAPWCPQHF
jgi:predicted acetyltransferase